MCCKEALCWQSPFVSHSSSRLAQFAAQICFRIFGVDTSPGDYFQRRSGIFHGREVATEAFERLETTRSVSVVVGQLMQVSWCKGALFSGESKVRHFPVAISLSGTKKICMLVSSSKPQWASVQAA